MNNGKICISVCAKTADELIEQISRAEELADVIEIRFDCLNRNEFDKLLNNLKSLREKCSKPFLVTFRPKEQGGMRKLDFFHDRIAFWLQCPEIRCADFVDIEFDLFCDYGHNWKLFEVKARNYICSFHNFQGTPKNLKFVYEDIAYCEIEWDWKKKRKADVIKIATYTHEVTHGILLMKLLERAKRENQQFIPIAMGEAGKWTRILGLAHGAFMTYAALDAGKETASGQITARDLIETYRVKELDEQTEIYGIVGNPVSHSLSPYIHNAAFKFYNLNAVYIPFEVQNLDEFITKFIRRETREIELNFKGFSVTIPHKQAIIEHLDFIDETAEKIGAVNTVKIVEGKLHGYNTDAPGFIEPLKNAYGDLKDVQAAILGNGGAARACIYALKKEAAKVTIFARDIEKAKVLAEEFEASASDLKVEMLDFKSFDIVINTTPLGTTGEMENETPVLADQMKTIHLAYDLIYNPFETRFLREAKSAGIPTVGGLAMLIAQAMAQFKIWTELDAPMKEMSRAARRQLQP